MEKRFMMLWNGGVYHNRGGKRNVFTLAELEAEFRDELHLGAKVRNSCAMDDEQQELDTLLELFELMVLAGETGEAHYIWERDLCERGDDYVTASLVEVLA
jgi:hypothetical protein